MDEATESMVLELRDVGFSYDLGERTAKPVFEGLSFGVAEGAVITITGPSGSGKTTMLDIVSGLIRPHSGQVFWDDVDLSTLSSRDLAKLRGTMAGYVAQNGSLDPDLTVWDQVELNATMLGYGLSANEIDASLSNVGINSSLFGKRPAQLSGGERQRVAVARAMALKPRLLFCDEPTSALDVESKRVVAECIANVCRQSGTTAMIVSHDMDVVAVSSTHWRMCDGRLAAAA